MTITWLLLQTGEHDGLAVRFESALYASQGRARVDVTVTAPGAIRPGEDLIAAAQEATRASYTVLSREGYLTQPVEVEFALEALPGHIRGRSAGLAFALAVAANAVRQAQIGSFAATGVVDEQGRVLHIGGIEAKIASALKLLPEGADIYYPHDNDTQIGPALREQALARSIALRPVERLEEALALVGIEILKTNLDNPFRGLNAFRYEDAGVFFGRQREIREITTRLQKRAEEGHPALVIIGPSGSGKSSLVQAGVMPELVKRRCLPAGIQCRWGLFRPRDVVDSERSDLEALCRTALVSWQGRYGLTPSVEQVMSLQQCEQADLLAERWQAALVAESARRPGQRLQFVWVLDQLEELFTLNYSETALQWLADLMVGLQRRGVWILGTLRADFISRYQQCPLARAVESGGLQDLLPPDAEAIEQIIEGPAQCANLTFETDPHGVSLITRIRLDAGGERGLLPLLEFVLDELYQQRTERTLTFQAYANLGGLQGSIATQAEAVEAQLDADEQETLPVVLLQLTAVDPRDVERLTSKAVPLSVFGEDTPARRVVMALLAARLLVMEGHGEAVRIAHESLYTHWGSAKAVLGGAQHARLVAREQLEQAAVRWNAASKKDRYSLLIPTGRLLKEAKRLRAEWSAVLPPLVNDYIAESVQARRRRRLRVGAGVTFLLLTLALGYWDWTRVTSDFYEDVVYRWGIPEGINPIDDTQRVKRNLSYRIDRQRGHVVELARINGSGSPNPDDKGLVRWTYSYDVEGNLIRVSGYNRNDQLVGDRAYSFNFRKTKSVTARLKYESQEGSQTLDTQDLFGEGQGVTASNKERGKGEITQERLTFNAKGWVSQRAYQNNYGTPTASALGNVGSQYMNHPLGQVTVEQFVDHEGQPTAVAKGIAQIRYNYQDNRLIEQSWYDINGALAYNTEGCASEQWRYNKAGNVIENRCLGLNGQPRSSSDGHASRRMEYDARGNQVAVSFFGTDGQPVLHNDGDAGWRGEYDARGNQVTVSYFGSDGQTVLIKDGFASSRGEYDARGNRVAESYFGTDGKPVLLKDGYAKVRIEYDAHGNTVATHFFGIDGQPALNDEGYASWRNEFDARGNEVATSYFGTDGKPVLHKDGYASSRSEYDARGNQVTTSFFGTDDQPVLIKDGYASWRAEYDAHGNMVSVRFFGIDGQPALNDEGYASWRNEFDARGNQVTTSFFGTDGKPVLHKDGYASSRGEYDARGNRVAESFFGTDGQPMLDDHGVASVYYKFNSRGYETKREYFDTEGNPILCKHGTFRRQVDYDSRGNEVKVSVFDTDGQPALNDDGYASWRNEFDARGNDVATSYFGTDGKPVLHKDGYASSRMEYDARGNNVAVSYFGTDGKPVMTDNGYASVSGEYDKYGNLVITSYFDTDGKPVSNQDEVVSLRIEYDTHGNEVVNSLFGTDGKPVLNKDGYASWHSEYDVRGNRSAVSFFGTDGKPVLQKDGYAIVRIVYDAHGNTVAVRFFGIDGQPALNDEGYASSRGEYDARGNQVAESFFGTDGKPVLHKDGYASSRSEYDVRGNRSAVSFFGTDDQPVLIKDGYASWRTEYDARGNEVAESYFGIDGKLVRPSNEIGCPTVRSEYNHNGEVITASCFDEHDQQTRFAWGAHQARSRYDARQNLLERAYFDIDGTAINVNDGFAIRRMQYDVIGREIERKFFDAEGSPTDNSDGFHRIVKAYDRFGNLVSTTGYDLTSNPAH